ncbi:MAG TPA: hypothetical protein VN310_04035 [Candidatus Dormibacteraeota bacterium]|jgi:hypothetical protein|nr:hypothetical protein [Candidatus Dormibacteraeota bacterium]
MRKPFILALSIVALLLLSSCSPRDFLTRRLAADLIAGSATFRAQQSFQLRTGVIANKNYLSPDYLVLQHRGWISATTAPCPATMAPPPCWDVMLTPSGVDTFQSLIAPGDAEKQTFSIPAARRELVAITGIAKQGNVADIEFTWRWVPLNEVGAVLYPGDARYRSTASFRNYDDGWRLVENAHPAQPLDDALKNSEPAP